MSSRRSLLALHAALLAAIACGDSTAPLSASLALQGPLEVGDSARVVITRDGSPVPLQGATVTFAPATTAHLLPSGWARFDAAGPLTATVTLPDGASGSAAVVILAGSTVALEGTAMRGDSARLVITRNGASVPASAVAVSFTPSANAHLLLSGWVKYDLAGALDVAVTFTDGASRHVAATVAPSPAGVSLQGRLERGDSARVVVRREGAVVPAGGYTLAISPSAGAHLLANGWLQFDATGALDVAATFPDGGTGHVAVTIAAAPTLALEGALVKGDSARLVIVRNGASVSPASVAIAITPGTGAHLLGNGWVKFDAAGPLSLLATFPDGATARASAFVSTAAVSLTLDGPLVQGDSARVVISSAGSLVPVQDAQLAIAPSGAAHLLASGWLRFDAPGPLGITATLADGAVGHVDVTVVAPVVTLALEGRLEQGDSARLVVRREGVVVPDGGYDVALAPASVAHRAGAFLKFDATGALEVTATLATGGSGRASVTIAPAPALELQGSLVRGDSARVIVMRGGAAVPTSAVTIAFAPVGGAHLLPSGWAKFDAAGALQVVATFADGATARTVATIAPAPLLVSLEGTFVQGDSARVVITSAGAPVAVQDVTLTITPSTGAHLLPSGWLFFDATGSIDVAAAQAGGGSGRTVATVRAPVVTVTLEGRLERSDSVRVVITREGQPVRPQDATVTVTPSATAHLLPSGWLKLDEAGAIDVAVALATGGGAHVAGTVATPPLIVFDFLEAGNRDIYVMALDGRDRRRLTTSTGDDQHPTAVGGRVVFTSYRDGNAELYSVPIAGGGDVRLTNTSVAETEPTLSPDGTRLAYISNASGAGRLWLATAQGTGGAAVPTGAQLGSVEAQPAWSPSGDRVAFTSTNAGTADLYSVPAAGGAVTPYAAANTDKPEVESVFTMDGLSLVFVSSRTAGSGLFRLRFGDASPSLLLAGSVGQPAALADGRIVFTQFDGPVTRLRWIDPAEPSVLHDIPAGTGSAAHVAPVR